MDDAGNLNESASEANIRTSFPHGRYDRLVVFQATPLVYQDDADGDVGGELHPLPPLDHEYERQLLSESLKEAEEIGAHFDIVFENATTERFSAFLAMGHSVRSCTSLVMAIRST